MSKLVIPQNVVDSYEKTTKEDILQHDQKQFSHFPQDKIISSNSAVGEITG